MKLWSGVWSGYGVERYRGVECGQAVERNETVEWSVVSLWNGVE